MAAVIRAPAHGTCRRTPGVIRANVAAARRARQRGDGARVELGELIGLGVLTAVLLQTKRAHVCDRLAAGRVGDAAAGMADHGAEHTRARAGERPGHGRALAEPLELDPCEVDAEISLDLLENVVDERRVRRGGPEPARGIGRDEDRAPLREIEEAEVRRTPRDVAPFARGAVEADDQPVGMGAVVVGRPAKDVLSLRPAAADRVVGERRCGRAVLQRRRFPAARGHHRGTADATGTAVRSGRSGSAAPAATSARASSPREARRSAASPGSASPAPRAAD